MTNGTQQHRTNEESRMMLFFLYPFREHASKYQHPPTLQISIQTYFSFRTTLQILPPLVPDLSASLAQKKQTEQRLKQGAFYISLIETYRPFQPITSISDSDRATVCFSFQGALREIPQAVYFLSKPSAHFSREPRLQFITNRRAQFTHPLHNQTTFQCSAKLQQASLVP